MNIGTLIYLVFTVTVVIFASILAGRYLYSRKNRASTIDDIDLRSPPSRKVAKTAIALAYYGIIIREDILKNSASTFDDDAYLRSFISFLTPDNIRAIKSTHAERFNDQY
jgi:hypothetical protein